MGILRSRRCEFDLDDTAPTDFLERLVAISRTFAPARDLEIQGAGRSRRQRRERVGAGPVRNLGVDPPGRANFDEPSTYFFVVPAFSALACW
jgi:hypothetical protein